MGHDYWHLMSLAGRYAYAGREWVARTAVDILGGDELELVHNHHKLRLGRGARRLERRGHPKGRHAGLAGSEGVRRRIDG